MKFGDGEIRVVYYTILNTYIIIFRNYECTFLLIYNKYTGIQDH